MAVQNIKNYTNLYQNNNETLTLINFILLKLGFYCNEKTIAKNSKKLNFSSKLLEDSQILKELIKTNSSDKFSLKTEHNAMKLNLRDKKKQLIKCLKKSSNTTPHLTTKGTHLVFVQQTVKTSYHSLLKFYI